MLFLVRIDIVLSDSIDSGQAQALVAAERVRAAELASDGHIQRLWRDSNPEVWANWGLWQAQDKSELIQLINTLPLQPYMTIAIHSVSAHPSDPLSAAVPSGYYLQEKS